MLTTTSASGISTATTTVRRTSPVVPIRRALPPTSATTIAVSMAGPTVAKSNTLAIGTDPNMGWLIGVCSFHVHHRSCGPS
ncbi:hypothetical protein M4D79_18835 [Mycolicibacterium novocastrense]|nr:hypothetical protein M4D79_18835 [Mycolicibacterium novocastrense]